MKTLCLVARNEVMANRLVFAVAALIGLLPLTLPLTPGLHSSADTMGARNVGALLCAVMESLILSAAFGWSVIGRDLAERRLGFYFARPIGAGALWAGKFVGAIIVIAGATIVTMLPAVILDVRSFRQTVAWRPSGAYLSRMPIWVPILVLAGACLFLLAFSHALGIILRSRSVWATMHLPLTVIAILSCAGSVRRLADNFAFAAITLSLSALACIVLILLWTAVGFQVSLGRTELSRGHRVLSLALWPALFVALSGLNAYSHWVDGVDATCVDDVLSVGETYQGNWVSVCGITRARQYIPCFLFDTVTGKSVKTGALEPDRGFQREHPVVSSDGTRAAWLQGPERGAARAITIADLRASDVSPTLAPVSVTGSARLALSRDGGRVAVLQPHLLSIYALQSGEYLGGTALRSPEGIDGQVQFLTTDLVRIYLMGEDKDSKNASLDVLDFDTAAHKLATVATIRPLTHAWLPPDPASTKLVVWKPGAYGPVLCDLFHGAEERVLMPSKTERPDERRAVWSLRFLADGRIAILAGVSLHAQLHFFSASGEALGTMDLPGDEAALVEEYAPGRLVVAVYSQGRRSTPGSLYVADLESRELNATSERLIPTSIIMPNPHLLTQESLRSQLYLDPRAEIRSGNLRFSLVEFDALRGVKRTLIGPSAAPSDVRR